MASFCYLGSFCYSPGCLVVACGLSCSGFVGSEVSQSGVELVSVAAQGEFLNAGPPGKSQPCSTFMKSFGFDCC